MPHVSFSQAQGFEAMPEQSKLGTISRATKAGLWAIVHDEIDVAIRARLEFSQSSICKFLRKWWVEAAEHMIDDAPRTGGGWKEQLRPLFDLGFPQAYNFIQYMLDYEYSATVSRKIATTLEKTRAAYRVVDGKIVPFSSPEEFAQLAAAFDKAAQTGARGCRTHLSQAGAELTGGNWAQAIHECVSAVEAAARLVSGEHSSDLGAILRKLQADGKLNHPALAKALGQLYGYASDAKGVRHSLVLRDEAEVTEREAFLMFGLCASFVTYLLSVVS